MTTQTTMRVTNSFTTFELSEADALCGSIFTAMQKRVLHNLLATYAEEKLVLAFDVNNPNVFIQEEACVRGKIELLQYILANSDACQEAIDYADRSPVDNF